MAKKKTAQLTTDRLDLVRFSSEHLDELHSLWIDPEVRRYLWDDRIISRQEAAEAIEASSASFKSEGFGFWLLVSSEGGKSVGFAGLRRFGDGDEVEILYGLTPDSWRQGLATEAARRILRCAFEDLELDEIFAGADPPNKRSFRVMERLGFEPHGRRVIRGIEADYCSVTRQRFLERESPTLLP